MRTEFDDGTLNKVVIKPNEIQKGDRFGLKVVAVIGYGGDWAAYMGDPTWSSDEIARHGDKLSESAAKQLFPTLAFNFIYRQ